MPGPPRTEGERAAPLDVPQDAPGLRLASAVGSAPQATARGSVNGVEYMAPPARPGGPTHMRSVGHTYQHE